MTTQRKTFASNSAHMQKLRLAFSLLFLMTAGGVVSAEVRNDFDGDGISDPAIYEPVSGEWRGLLSGSGYALATAVIGSSMLAPIAADFDGDAKVDPAGYDEYHAVFYARLSGSSYASIAITGFGGVGFTPHYADYDGDGKADPAVYDETSGTWLCRLSSLGYATNSISGFKGLGYALAPADYDGDRKTDPAVYQADLGMWHVRPSTLNGGEVSLPMGGHGYSPVYGDFDSDRLDDPAVYKEADGTWLVRMSGAGITNQVAFGGWGMRPVSGDYDGDGKADPAVYCSSNGLWRVLLSASGYALQTFSFSAEGAAPPDHLGAHVSDNDPQPPFEWFDWMSYLSDDVYLSEVSIPGTHDTGADEHTSQQGSMAQYVIAQDYVIGNQLAIGVRWCDIRLSSDLSVFHGPYYLHKSFDNMLQSAINFVHWYPSEVVVFMIKQEHTNASDHDFGAAVYSRLQAWGLDNFYLQNRVPTVGEARGKIVIVRQFGNDLGVDLGMQFSWDDNTTGGSFSTGGIDIYVQDHYSLNTVAYSTKIAEIENTASLSRAESNRLKFYLNFTSGEQDASLISVHTVAANINPSIADYTSNNYRRCGVIMLNFAGGDDNRGLNPELVMHIIYLNDGPPFPP